MNRQEIEKAIHTLECARLYIFENSNRQDYSLEALDRLSNAVDDAKSALEHQLTNGWISCIDKYPEECERVIVWDSLNNRIAIAYFSCPHWEADDGRINVIAWQPLPEPYKEVSNAKMLE